MSYHDIAVVPRYRITCLTCKDLVLLRATAGEAEQAAKAHIESEAIDAYSHTLEIQTITAVGRYADSHE